MRRCLYKREGESASTTSEIVIEQEGDRAVVCVACRHELTRESARMEVAGRHRHTCVNPAGVVYRIACFAVAPGCGGHGEWSEFFSWFAGYAWQIALCSGCRAHVGWAFAGSDAPFHGLIEERVEPG
jgi:hypothetical protein